MCGIVGMVASFQNGFSTDEQKMFKDMLFLDTQRGWDSTGVFLVENNSNVHIRKAAIHGPDFIRHREYQALERKGWSTGMFMVGHNRAATRGTVNDTNAHPFWVEDKIVLVQNGTYIGSHKHHKDVEVDSEAIAHVLADHDNIEEALQKINAAYALVWYNVKTKSLHLIRNNERPLWIVETTDGGYLFASECETILYAASRAKVRLKDHVQLLTPGELHTFTIDGRQWKYEVGPLDYKFQHQHAPASTEYDEDLTHWQNYRQYMGTGSYRHDYSPPVDLNTVRQAVEHSTRIYNEKTLYDYIIENKFEEFRVSDAEADEIKELFRVNKPDTVLVEFTDYVQLYDDPKNLQWLVYGSMVTSDPSKPSPLVYLRLQRVTEIEALNFTSVSLYQVEPTSGVVHHTVTPTEGEKYNLVTLFCTHPVPVLTTEVKQLECH